MSNQMSHIEQNTRMRLKHLKVHDILHVVFITR